VGGEVVMSLYLRRVDMGMRMGEIEGEGGKDAGVRRS